MYPDTKSKVRRPPCRVLILFIALFVPLQMGCYRSSAYRGDGKIIAVRLGNWLMSCTYYEVSLGSINLKNKSKSTFAVVRERKLSELLMKHTEHISNRERRLNIH